MAGAIGRAQWYPSPDPGNDPIHEVRRLSHKGKSVDSKQLGTLPGQGERAQDSCGSSIAKTFVSGDQPGTSFGLLNLEAEELDRFTVLSRDYLD
jgi:hypothetical protein